MGGAVSDTGYGISIDSNGNAYIAGTTSSPSFPNATNSLNGTGQDAFITELNPTARRCFIIPTLEEPGRTPLTVSRWAPLATPT